MGELSETKDVIVDVLSINPKRCMEHHSPSLRHKIRCSATILRHHHIVPPLASSRTAGEIQLINLWL